MENMQDMGYGFSSDAAPKGGALQMGLNTGFNLEKFAYVKNGGKDGNQSFLEIIFSKDGSKVYANKFAITKAFAKAEDGSDVEVTAPNHPAMVKARNEMTAGIIHIMKAFVPEQELRSALSVPIQSFEQYCVILQGLLPANYSEFSLDLFAHYQWNIKGENTRTYAELPKNMKQGKWVTKSVQPKGSDSWEKVVNANDKNSAMKYVDGEGNVHPFVRSAWFLTSNFAIQQQEEGMEQASQMNQGAPAAQGGDTSGW